MYYLLYRRVDRKKQQDFLWWAKFYEKPTDLQETPEFFCLKIIEIPNTDMNKQIMIDTWSEIEVIDWGNVLYR